MTRHADEADYRALVCTALTGPAGLEVQRLAPRPLKPGEVRVAVRAAGLNFPDLLMTYGSYQFRPEPPFVPGLEFAGVVTEVHNDVTRWVPGDRVMGGAKGGGIATQAVVPAETCRPLPAAFDFAEGACWRGAAVTAWHALHDKAGLAAGESVLVLGAGGGVGMASVMLAKHLGAMVIGVASTPDKRAAVEDAGADRSIDPADMTSGRAFGEAVKALTDGKGVDVVLDPVGGDLALRATRAIGWGGRYLVVGFASGEIPSFSANHALIKGYSIIGLRAGESARRDPELAKQTERALDELAERAVMCPHISHRLTLSDAKQAFEIIERRAAIGRIVVDME